MTVEEVTKSVSSTLRPFEAKDLAHATGGSIRAAHNVREGLNAMSLTGFLNACRAIPELRALAMELMGCDGETDPEFVRGLTLLLNAHARRSPPTSDASHEASTPTCAGDGIDLVTGDLFDGAAQ